MLKVCGLLAALSMSAVVAAQTPGTDSGVHFFSDGTIANGVYKNQCFGFSLPIPSGWEIRIHDGSLGDYAANFSLPGPGKRLLILDRTPASSVRRHIALTEPTPYPTPTSAKDFVNTFVQIETKVPGRELVHDAVEVTYGGQTFSRADYKITYRDGEVLYFALIYTTFRKRFLGATLTAGSPAELDQFADFLRQIAFEADEVDPKCVDGSIIAAPINGSGKPPFASSTPDPKLAQVSEAIGQSMRVKHVDPEYPEVARKALIKGQVKLLVTVSENGDVENVAVISGHPLLIPAAIAAVKQWKYKPFLRDGSPTKMQTQVTVDFDLAK